MAWQFNNLWKKNILAVVIVDYPVDPGDVVADFGVDSWEIRVGTADAPGHDPLKITVTDERPARVALQPNTARCHHRSHSVKHYTKLFVLAKMYFVCVFSFFLSERKTPTARIHLAGVFAAQWGAGAHHVVCDSVVVVVLTLRDDLDIHSTQDGGQVITVDLSDAPAAHRANCAPCYRSE